MEIFDVVKKLTGEIKPAGSSEIDEQRFENLKVYCDLIQKMRDELCEIAWDNRTAYQFSIKKAVKLMNDTLDKLAEE